MALISSLDRYEDAQGNSILAGNLESAENIGVFFHGTGCRLRVFDGCIIRGLTVTFGAHNSELVIGSKSIIQGASFMIGADSGIWIGDGFTMTGGGRFSAAEKTRIDIQPDCMCAVNFDIRSDHAHPIFDGASLKRVNPSRSVHIGQHVWIGPDVFVMPGAKIGDGAIIGARSIVTRPVQARTLAVGAPAHAVKHNIVWSRAHVALHQPFQFPDGSAVGITPIAAPPGPEADSTLSWARRLFKRGRP